MRQHLANAVFRAVENERPLLRVTNSGITAYVTAGGEVKDESQGFQRAVRTWTLGHNENNKTFYTRFGDVFAGFNVLLTTFVLVSSVVGLKKESRG
jgi:apolipoprotein N-acyltransferase